MGSTDMRNPAAERLASENDTLRRQLAELRRDPGDVPATGCGDTSCVVAQPKGMATNGGCRCDPREVRRALQYWRRVARFREATIRKMAEDVARAHVATYVTEALAMDADVRLVCIVGERRSVSIETRRKEGIHLVMDDRGHERRSMKFIDPTEAAERFAAWLREAQGQEKKA
jgi:hypothetical protein